MRTAVCVVCRCPICAAERERLEARAPKPWIVVNGAEGGRVECLRCGATLTHVLPMPVAAYVKTIGAFVAGHGRCGEDGVSHG